MTEQWICKKPNLLRCSRRAYKNSDPFTFDKYIHRAYKGQLILWCICLPDCSLAKWHRGSTMFRVHTAGLLRAATGGLCQGTWVAPSQLGWAGLSCTTGQPGDPAPHSSYRQFLAWKIGLFVSVALLLAQKPGVITAAPYSKGSHTR